MATTTASKKLNVFQKIAAIRKEIPTLQKNGELQLGQGRGYKFLAVDDILAAVKPVEDKYGIIVILEDGTIGFHYNTALPKDDGRAPVEKVQGYGLFNFWVINTEADDPTEDSFRIQVPAEGGDTADKSTRKTVTQAQKIAYITLYNLITGEPDPDGSEGANGGDADKPAPAAVQKAAAPKTSTPTPRAQVKAEFIDTGKKTAKDVNAIKNSITGLEGDALYAEVLKRLRAED